MRCNDRPAAARPVAARPLVLLAVFLAAVIVPASAQIANPRLRVSTSTGTILGSICPEGRINTFRFLGIPYAQAPTGANRFAPPRALANSTAEVNANRRVACIQELPPPGTNPDGNITFTEDCLTLNIWSPGPITPRVPVRVFLHSNDLERGSANNQAYDGCVSSTDANIITITINYRLGALGFLSLPGLVGPNNSTGNWGVLDQQLALRWITDNIGAFGGDPSRITLHAHGAGATMALVHMVAPSSVGPNRLPTLFSGVILQSPKPTYYNSLSDAQTVGGEYMYRTGCNNLQCLRDLDTTAIVAAQLEMVRPFGPTIDGVVLSEAPYALASRGQITRVPILVLTSMEEANLDVIQQQGSRPMNAETSRDIVLELTNPPLQFRNRIASVYSTSNSETNNWGSDWFRATAMAVTEGVYHCGTRTLIDFVSALGAEVYVGMVSIPRSGQTTCAFQLLGLPADAARPLLPRLGYTNGYDLPLTFLAPFANLPAGCAYSDAERQTSAFIASSVAAFLENRHPIPRSSRGNLTVAPTMAAQREWPRYHPNGGIPGDRASVLIVNAERTFASIWPEDATSRCEVWDAVHVDMDNNGRYGEYPTVREFIESRAGDQGDLSLLLAAVQNTELWDELYEVEGTFFLPTNEAVQTLLSETGLTPEQLLNLDELEDILLYHTLNFTLDVARANPPRRRIFTRNGAPVYLQKTGEGAGLEVRLIDRDLAPSRVLPSARSIIAGRSYVNLVDRVMTPFCTEFAPEEGIARRRLNRRH